MTPPPNDLDVLYLRGPESCANGLYELFNASGRRLDHTHACCLTHVMLNISMAIATDDPNLMSSHSADTVIVFIGSRPVPRSDQRPSRTQERWLHRRDN
jgi:hypothetical protein